MALLNLEGVKAKITNCEFFSTPEEMELILKNGVAATTAGDNGAINVYRDDEGAIRCEAMRHLSSIDKKIYQDIEGAKAWSKKWLKKIK